MERIFFKGTVTEVRTFRDGVYLFLKCNFPQKVKGKIVRFSLNEGNCCCLNLAAGLCKGATAVIERDCNRSYYVDATEDAISADII